MTDEDQAEDGQDVEESQDVEEGGETTTESHATAVLTHVVKSVVGDPDAVVVNVDGEGSDTLALTVEVGPGDMGRVIGRRGRIANAIRTVVRSAGAIDDVKVDVEFLD